MKLFLLLFSIVLLFTLSTCNPQGQRRRPRPRPTANPTTSSTTTSATTTVASPTPPRTTPSQAFFQCLQNCPTTSEYNPICGSNQMVYQNMGKFMCAQFCGSGATLIRRGNCAGIF